MSTFIEYVKKYVNQEYAVDENVIGRGNTSTTAQPTRHIIKSNLPAYEVLDAKGARIDIYNLANVYPDVDDYADALKDRKVKMQVAPHDPSTPPPKEVEITFLDTPGIENTEGKDVEKAPGIMEEVTRTRSFNLIIIFINSQDHPSTLQQLSFDYYSKVIQQLQGHHSNIIFLFTHVKYEENHPSYLKQVKNMEIREKAFSHLFREALRNRTRPRLRSKGIRLYPCYHIDLFYNLRTIPRCMMQNTIRDILQLAAAKRSSTMDTSNENLDRVWGIPRPESLEREKREKILARIASLEESLGEDLVEGEAIEASGDDSEDWSDIDDPEAADYEAYFKDTPKPNFHNPSEE